MADILKLPHLSWSQVNMLGRCGEQYRRRYVLGEKVLPGASLIRGTGVHRARAKHMRHKLTSDDVLPIEAVEQEALDSVSRAFEEEVYLTNGDREKGIGVVLGETRDTARRLSHLDYLEFGLACHPVEVEQTLAVQPRGFDVPLVGIVDLITAEKVIPDAKSTKKSPPATEADDSDQLTMYSLLYRANHKGEEEAGLALEWLVDTKTPKTVRQVTTRDESDYEPFLNRIGVSWQTIQAGLFVPCSKGAWQCDPRYCGYHGNGCLYVNGKRRPRT